MFKAIILLCLVNLIHVLGSNTSQEYAHPQQQPQETTSMDIFFYVLIATYGIVELLSHHQKNLLKL